MNVKDNQDKERNMFMKLTGQLLAAALAMSLSTAAYAAEDVLLPVDENDSISEFTQTEKAVTFDEDIHEADDVFLPEEPMEEQGEEVFTEEKAELSEIVASGECGDNATYTLDDEGTLTISGTGALWDRAFNNLKFKHVIISNGITHIGDSDFADSGFESIVFPPSIKSTGHNSFGLEILGGSLKSLYINDLTSYLNIDFDSHPMWFATKLYINNKRAVNITIPDGVKNIPDYAFAGSDSITSVTIPDSVQSIGNRAFANCDRLEKVKFGNGLTDTGDSAFLDCDSLTELDFGSSIKTISEYSFQSCDALANVTIPDNIVNIKTFAFYNCGTIPDLVIGRGIKTIGSRAFDYTFPENVYINDITAFISIDFTDFSSTPLRYASNIYINGKLTRDIVIPDSAEKLNEYAFLNCSGIRSIIIGSGITHIDPSAFDNNDSLTSVKLENGVTSIAERAFNDCNNLSYIIIPTSVTEIEAYAFNYCNKLSVIEYGGSEAEWKDIFIGDNNAPLKNAEIHYNSPLAQPQQSSPIPSTTLNVSKSDNGDKWHFDVSVGQKYYFSHVYAAIYDSNGKLINTEVVPVNMDDGDTGVDIAKTDNDSYANIMLWYYQMQPLSNTKTVILK